MQKIVADLRTLPLEPGGGSPSHSGWTGTIDSFRIDPHEFSNDRAFFFDDVRITADWRADGSFPIEWTFEDADTPTGATMSLYYDTDQSGYNGTLIQSGISVVPGNGSYDWNTSGFPGGTYYVYAVVTDTNANQNRFYATGPLIVKPWRDADDRFIENVVQFRGASRTGRRRRPRQRSMTNGGTGTLSLDGDAVGGLDLGLARKRDRLRGYDDRDRPDRYVAGILHGDDRGSPIRTPRTRPKRSTSAWMSCRSGTDSPPFGNYATPTNGATVASSIPVTGWVLDDVGIQSVKIYRGTGLSDRIFIGDAVFSKGARPDVEAAYPGYPQNDRAGWGYMLLTNFLPNGGTGRLRSWPTRRIRPAMKCFSEARRSPAIICTRSSRSGRSIPRLKAGRPSGARLSISAGR